MAFSNVEISPLVLNSTAVVLSLAYSSPKTPIPTSLVPFNTSGKAVDIRQTLTSSNRYAHFMRNTRNIVPDM